MLRTRKRPLAPKRRAGQSDGGLYIEYVVRDASERRHRSEEGGTLTAAARVVALVHMRPLRAGRKVRITLLDAPATEHVTAAQAIAEAHGLRLIPFRTEPKAFVVESLVADEEDVHLLAS